MDVRKGIVIASFGDRDEQIQSMVDNVRKWTAGHKHLQDNIWLITDRGRQVNCNQKVLSPQNILWREHPRWGIRNTNLWLAKAALWPDFDVIMCLNDDMRIVHSGFLDGFCLAQKFGVCVPMNPRIYVRYNAMGADTTEEDRKETDKGPVYGPACNMSPMFACRLYGHAKILLEAYIEELFNCMRGTLAFWLASYRTGITPLYLPEQWCVCGNNARYIKNYRKPLMGQMWNIEPIMLHWGQEQVRAVFNDLDKI